MSMSSRLVAPAFAILSTLMLYGPAASQTAAGSNAPLPDITVEAPKRAATPHQSHQAAHAVASRRAFRTAQGPSSSGQTSSTTAGALKGPVMRRIASLEARASSCNGGCETSFKTGNAPWIGCSESAGRLGVFSATCRDTLTYKDYADCVETKWFLAWDQQRIRWVCSSLMAAGKFKSQKVSEQSAPAHPYLTQRSARRPA
jgi:hypothetical protein